MTKTHLINADCLLAMKRIPDKSIDAVITSPPYNMNLRIRNGKYCSRQIVKEISTKYENFADNLPMDEYFEFNKKIISECLRVSDLVFFNIQMITGNKPALFALMGEFSKQLKEVIIWDKVNAQPAIGQGVLNSRFEFLLVFQSSNAISRCFKTSQFGRGELDNLWQIKRGKKYCKTLGAEFPLELPERIIKNFLPPRPRCSTLSWVAVLLA